MFKAIKLNYDYDGLEPFIDTHTMGLHYNKHYMNYLNKLNQLLKKYNLSNIDKVNDVLMHINYFEKNDKENVIFNLGGVLNHELYFSNISPNKNNKPVGMIKNAIDDSFGSFDKFKEKFIESIDKLKGSGYTFLVIDKQNNLSINNYSNQLFPILYNNIAIMNIDLWEHAYYLNYKNNKKEYIDNYFEILDWDKINQIYEKNKTV